MGKIENIISIRRDISYLKHIASEMKDDLIEIFLSCYENKAKNICTS